MSTDKPAPKKRWLRLALRLLGPIVLLIVVLRIDEPRKLWDVVSQASAGPLVVAAVGAFGALHCKVVRWRGLLAARGYRYSLRRSYTAFLASVYVGMMTPGRVGDVLRIQYVRHDLGMPYADGLAVIVMDRFCDLYVLVAFVTVGAVRFGSILRADLLYVTLAAVAVAILAPLVLLVPGVADKVMSRIYARLAGDSDGMDAFLASLRSLVNRRLIGFALITVAAFGFNYGQGWFLARSIQLQLGFIDVVALLSITSLLGLMPISISGLGVRELFLALVFPVLGFTQEQGVAFGLLVFVFLYLIFVAIGFVAWQLRPPPVVDLS